MGFPQWSAAGGAAPLSFGEERTPTARTRTAPGRSGPLAGFKRLRATVGQLCWPILWLSCGQCGPILWLCWPMLPSCWQVEQKGPPILGLCWPILGLCWPILELCWPILGLCCPFLESMLAHLEAMLAHLEAYVGPCWPSSSHEIRKMGKNGTSTRHRKTRYFLAGRRGRQGWRPLSPTERGAAVRQCHGQGAPVPPAADPRGCGLGGGERGVRVAVEW